MLRYSFAHMSSCPDRVQLGLLSMITGLTERVCQVWHQNMRARVVKTSRQASTDKLTAADALMILAAGLPPRESALCAQENLCQHS